MRRIGVGEPSPEALGALLIALAEFMAERGMDGMPRSRMDGEDVSPDENINPKFGFVG